MGKLAMPPRVESPREGLLEAYDELRAVEDGLWGLMGLICDDRKRVRLDTVKFHFAVEPLLFRMKEAVQLLDRSRQTLYPPAP